MEGWEAFAKASWEDILPFYEELASRELDLGTVEQWLADWSSFEERLSEAGTRAEFAYSRNTADAQAEAAQKRFGEQIEPKAGEQRVRLQKRLVEMDYEGAGMEVVMKEFRSAVELFRAANVPLEAEISSLVTEWNKVNGDLGVDWEGQEVTPEALVPFLLSTDRGVREKAFRLRAQAYLEKRETLSAIFDQMHALRSQTARNAGFANYRDYAHTAMCRFDYTPDDCARFCEAVEAIATPAAARVLERRRQKMGLERLRPWDLAVDAQGRGALQPFDSEASLVGLGERMVGRVDQAFTAYYRTMVEQGTLDLFNRKGKAPGGYSDILEQSKLPVIFMNAVGVDEDVRTLLHESGHAFHWLEAARQPLVFQRNPGSEIAEVASMAMELLASPYLAREAGGCYSEAEANRSRIALLEDIILFLPHCASVDAWQQWAYTNEAGADLVAREAKWLELRMRFEGDSVDWSGMEEQRVARWYQQPHFFSDPFYYIEYGIAQMGALQVWRNRLRNPAKAVADYRAALALGSSVSLPELYARAGAKLVFDKAGMQDLVEMVEGELAALEVGKEEPAVGLI